MNGVLPAASIRAEDQAGLLARRPVQLAVLVLLAFALMAATLGDTNRHADETFYFLVGQRMHEGLLPYVDVWDRKPFGLFAIYYLIAAISRSVLAYQVTACLLAGLAAWLVCLIVTRWAGWKGGVLAGVVYIISLGAFEGATGQTPDFYNPLIAGAVLLLLHETDRFAARDAGWRTWCAMALCGLALTIKQTTLFESVFLGLFAVFCLLRAGTPIVKVARIAAACCVLGALPTVAIALFYVGAGHWDEFWHAMVISNLVKAKEGGEAWQSLVIAVKSAPLLILAAWGLLSPATETRARLFVAAWLVAALVGLVSVPNFYEHYMLPVLVPLSVAAGLALGRQSARLAWIVAAGLYSLLWYNPADPASTRESNRTMNDMARAIRQHDPGGGLLVFDAPVYLYALADKRFLSPLVFPHHLNHQIENNVSHLDTHAEIDRILRNRPGVIAIARYPRSHPVNDYSRTRVLAYSRENCAFQEVFYPSGEDDLIPIVIFGDCGMRQVGREKNDIASQ